MRPFRRPLHCLVICATQRSGSSFFARVLSELPIGSADEWLLTESLDFARKEWGLPPESSLWDALQAVVSLKQDSAGRFAVKIMWETLAETLSELRQENAKLSSLSDRELVTELFPNARFIYLYRKDLVAQAVSYAKADQLDQWRAEDRKEIEKAAGLSFQFDDIYNRFAYLEQSIAGWKQFFEATKLAHLTIAYEAFIEDPGKVLQEIAASLNLEAPARLNTLTNAPGPMRTAINREWKERYIALLERMSGNAKLQSVERIPAAGRCARLHFPDVVVTAHPSDQWIQSIEVTNMGKSTWPCVGYPDRKGSVVLVAQLRSEAGEVLDYRRIFFSADVLPGATVRAEIPVVAPSVYGCYWLTVALEQWGWNAFNEEAELGIEVTPTWVEWQWDRYFPAAQKTTWGWRHDSVFGYFNTLQFPWLFHDELGWIFCSGSGGAHDDFWWWDWKLGLVWTSPKDFPRLYSFECGRWLSYQRGTKSPRRFTDLGTGEVIETERIG